MKAYYVRERLEFERGMEPKASMNIGISTKLKWNKFYPGEDFLPAEEVVKYLKNPKLIKYIIRGLRNQPEWTIDYQVKVFNYLIDHNGVALYKDLVPQRAIPKQTMHRIFKELFEKGILILERTGNIYKVYLNKINESINFERGLDPKKAMEIGKHHNNPFNKLENTYNYYNYAMRQNKNGLERLILKKASEFFGVSPEKILGIDSTNVSPDSILYPKNLSKLNIIKKETLKTPDTLPITINLTDKGFAYVLNNDGNIVLGILGTQY
ncbi:MAG: hypothetical protein PHF86_00735 [Candidatus Nanoarchaeia archaeon]|nr:hypothetical protein [Candidatus Nanoarchaeia archaeon]